MIFHRFGAGLALAAALAMAASPASADNYDAKDGNGVHQSFAAKLIGGILHPFHVLEGMFGGTPTPVNMTNSGALDTTCVAGCSGGTAFNITGHTTLAVTTSSARVAVPSADVTAIIQNVGNAPVEIKFGTSSVTAATTDFVIQPGQAWVLNTGGAADIAAITASGSSALDISTGTGIAHGAIASDLSKAGAVIGNTTAGSALTDAPLASGCLAKTSLPTAQTDGAAYYQLCDKYGRRISPSVLRENKGKQVTAITGASETTIVTADASNKLELWCLIVANTNTTNAVTVAVKDATSTGTGPTFQVPAGETRGFYATADSGLPQTAVNNNWTATATGTSPAYTVTACSLKSGS